MEPGPDFAKGGRPPRVLPAIVRRLSGSWNVVAFCVIAAVCLTIPKVLSPILASVLIDSVIIGGVHNWAMGLILLMGALIVLEFTTRFLELLYLRKLRLALTWKLSAQFLTKLLKLPIAFYAQRYAGDLACRIRDNHQVAEALTGKVAEISLSCVSMLLYFWVMMALNIQLTLLACSAAVVNLVVLQSLYKLRVEANIQMSQALGNASAVAIAGLQGIETIKSSGSEDGFFAKWSGYFSKASLLHQRLGQTGAVVAPLPGLLEGLVEASTLLLGGYEVLQGRMSLGGLVAFQALLRSFLEPVGTLTGLGTVIQDLDADLQRLDDVLDEPDVPVGTRPTENTERMELAARIQRDGSLTAAVGSSPVEALRLNGDVYVDKITFGYSIVDPPLIKDFSIHVKPGARVALVGGSGSGKSTIAKIIGGLYEPWTGQVLFDSRPRSDIPQQVLENSLAYVDQDIVLFEGSVRDNLSLWDATLPEATIHRALEDAVIEPVVRAMPGGLDAILQEGATNMSGGQRQRLEIARALICNPSILVFDEATSALDPESEALLMESLRRRSCTCIIVAHRLSTIRDCDEIVVLRYGIVAERGTHEQLCTKAGYYAKLIQLESQLSEEPLAPIEA
jgi:ATP-binding cassette subfamily C protein